MKYDLIVIGGGSAGHSAASTAAKLGLRCALVEAPGPLGGLCILRGCMPSKTIIETANRMRVIREADRFGITVGTPVLDLPRLRERAGVLLKDFRDYRREEMGTAGYELLRGTANLTSTHEVELAESKERHQAKAIIIATGSKPEIPEIEGLEGTPYWTSDDMIGLPELPETIAIVGHGAIGMEAAHLFEGLGSSVTVLVRGERILSHFDDDIAEAIEAESIDRGITFLKKTEIFHVEHKDGKFHLSLTGREKLVADALLVATGRTPNTIGFGFQKAGIAMDRKRILIDDRCSTSLPHIFAVGDCASPVPVVHLAVIQGAVAARNAERIIRDGHSELSHEWSPETAMTGLFTEPQCVEIGMGVKEAAEKRVRILTGRINYNDQGKGMISGSRHGFVKIIAEADSHRIIGAAAAGPEVLETSHVIQLAISRGMTLEEYAAVPHYHPTLVEAWASAAEAALNGAE
ncbi:NAD(P)/FAD-dependent oxidoreductase [Luteolibacter sp. SL250]|uniref:dihydrolipoyl dehydrogenase family protein n=1 Tax=Luteolibacter sp. SL250 TaxID=2995170 RepID=UPI00226EBD08|nr:NAD(P)/FAD-dependent oxidoreductase [Luteolibacter sp. SL250]WAC19359.1 NAD(P)/FAD-dependent oxidoreductase [Luteolibacter sp. SL250]